MNKQLNHYFHPLFSENASDGNIILEILETKADDIHKWYAFGYGIPLIGIVVL